MSKASDVIKIALAEVGYREKATNANLDLATANAGTGNWTKYARDLWQQGYYNGNKNGYAWCDVFVDWCFWSVRPATWGRPVPTLQAIIKPRVGTIRLPRSVTRSFSSRRGRWFTPALWWR